MRCRMAAVMAAMAPALLGAGHPAEERLVSGDGIVTATVDGTPTRVRIDPGAPGMPLFARSRAAHAGPRKKGRWGFGVGYAVGPVQVFATTEVVRLDWGAGPFKQGIGWTERPFAMAAEGSVGPATLPEPVVRFRLRAPRSGERTVSFRAVRSSGPLGLWARFGTTYAEVEVGGAPMRIRFDPYHPRTLATAALAVRLARLHDGVVSGDAVPTEIAFGVERPVRTLTLRRPLPLGTLAIGTLGVRTGDNGSTAALREAGSPAATVDPDEIVVVGKGARHDPRRDTLSLGADYLARCSEIVFDKRSKTISLSCLTEETR